MKKEKKNGFTLVELLAVIVILAIILVIAVPKVMSIIEDAKRGTLESTAKMIASGAEKQKVQNTVLGNNKEITCDSVAKINKGDYANCSIKFEDNIAKVTIEGSGKFEGLYVCNGTKTVAEASNDECSLLTNTAANFIASLCVDDATCTRNNLLKDIDGNIRYYGADPNNYIEFNNEVWRIVGVFNIKTNVSDIKGTSRIKIVRNENLDKEIAYDLEGSNTWVGSDLELYLNGTTEENYYYGLETTSKSLIEKAVWNTGILDATVQNTATEIYNLEKNVGTAESIFGLISVSDYGFAGESDCKVLQPSCRNNNWLGVNTNEYSFHYTMMGTSYADLMYGATTEAMKGNIGVSWTGGARPAVFLKSNVTITGTGENTTEGIYKISILE